MTIAWLEDLRKLGNIYKRAHIFISNYKEHNKIPYSKYKKVIKLTVQNMIKHENKTSFLNKLLNSCYNGTIQGSIIGMISGGPVESLTNGLIYGLSSPIVLFIHKKYMHNEELPLN